MEGVTFASDLRSSERVAFGEEEAEQSRQYVRLLSVFPRFLANQAAFKCAPSLANE